MNLIADYTRMDPGLCGPNYIRPNQSVLSPKKIRERAIQKHLGGVQQKLVFYLRNDHRIPSNAPNSQTAMHLILNRCSKRAIIDKSDVFYIRHESRIRTESRTILSGNTKVNVETTIESVGREFLSSGSFIELST